MYMYVCNTVCMYDVFTLSPCDMEQTMIYKKKVIPMMSILPSCVSLLPHDAKNLSS